MFALFAFMLTFIGCEPAPTSSSSSSTINDIPASQVVVKAPVFNAEKATAKGKEYIDTLYGTKSPNGPVCLGETVSDEYTQCSYTYTEVDSTLKAGTILCSNRGCMEGSAATTVAKEDIPSVVVNTTTGGTSGGMSNDWLFWYILMSNGGTSYHYNSWYSNTPAYGRTAYYSPGYIPSAQSRSYYTTTYSKPVATASATKYTSKTTSKSTVSSSTKSTSKSTAPSTVTTKKTTSSSGWGKSSRSSGYKSSGSSSRSSGRR